MIDDLDRTLDSLLRLELPAALVDGVTISFATPDSQFPPPAVALPAIDLFVYDIQENRDLRSNEWLVNRRSDGRATQKPPPVRVDCSYLITAWASDSAPNPTLDEHRLLGEVMRVLVRHPTIPSEVLQGSLRDQEVPLTAAVLQPGRLQSLGEFWQALGGKPKVALHYTVTIGVEPADLTEAPVVTDERLSVSLGREAGSG